MNSSKSNFSLLLQTVVFLVHLDYAQDVPYRVSHWLCDVQMTKQFVFFHLSPKQGSESLPCKDPFVVVACGRGVQDRADFSFQWKCVSLHGSPFALNTVPHQQCFLSVSTGSAKRPFPTQRISQALSNHSLCLDCSHLDLLLYLQHARPEVATVWKNWNSACVNTETLRHSEFNRI